jgi:hypothetical protein
MNKILINMSLIIKSVEIIGLLTDCKDNCNHFCIIKYIIHLNYLVIY